LLPPATEKVWEYLREQPALAGFVLAGGSALSLLLKHRVSEDLDFVFLAPRLPRQKLEALCLASGESGFRFTRNDDEAAVQEFAEVGMELHDYQQDYLVNEVVKVSFFAPDEAQQKVFSAAMNTGVRVATLPEIFKSKALVSALRSKTRDWLDLFLLLRDHGFSLRDYRAAFVEAGIPSQADTGLTRLCSGIPQRSDEGYSHLLTTPPTLEEMKQFFVAQRNKLEVELAAEAAARKAE
jgi:DNA-binding transcriptional MerR regulator